MNIWIDAQFPTALASWLNNTFEVNAMALRDLGLRDAKDVEILEAVRVANAVILTQRFCGFCLSIGDTSSNSLADLRQCYKPKFTSTPDNYFS
jgi:hypothetical protein